MGKKEKVIDLNAKAEKISSEHLTELQGIVNDVNKSQYEIGVLEVQKHHKLHTAAELQDKIVLFQDTLLKSYGSYDVNVSDGVINWPNEK